MNKQSTFNSAAEIAKYYISALDPNRFTGDGVTPEMIRQHEKELADEIEKLIELKCKELLSN